VGLITGDEGRAGPPTCTHEAVTPQLVVDGRGAVAILAA
jgi:hypothetical protein